MKEIGGYFELDQYKLTMLYEESVLLNCGRNCLAYLIEARNIKKIHLPYFICDSVIEVCRKYDIDVSFYNISCKFIPTQMDIKEDEWLYVVNYYGLLNEKVQREIVNNHRNVIIDNSQAYFSNPIEHVDTIYVCRKYFGVADGAILCTDSVIPRKLEKDKSYNRVHFVLGRFEGNASDFFSEAKTNNDFFKDEPIKEMSKLTYNMLHAIDYNKVKDVRTKNWAVLNAGLEKINRLNLENIKGGYMFPLMLRNANMVRKKLIEKKIYIPILWPDVLERMPAKSVEHQLAQEILPLPCDQRYDENDMMYIIKEINKILGL